MLCQGSRLGDHSKAQITTFLARSAENLSEIVIHFRTMYDNLGVNGSTINVRITQYCLSNPLFRSNITTARETPIGCSSIRLGEADLLLYKQVGAYENIAIIENKDLKPGFHEFCQVFGYLNYSFQFGVTISINQIYTIPEAKQLIITAVEEVANKGLIQVDKIEEVKCMPNLLISTHLVPENAVQSMRVYHFILNLNISDRQKVARSVRKRASPRPLKNYK